MREGHEANAFYAEAVLAGIFNRLGDGKSAPLKCEPPAWISREKIASSKEEIALARDLFERGLGQRGGGNDQH